METEVYDKLVDLKDAVKLIQDGSSIALGGWVISRCVVALVHEMIRQKKRNLIVNQGIGALDADLLIGAGCAKKYIYAGGSLEPAFGPLNCINRAIVEKELEVEELSGTAQCFRFLAGALGIPYIPIKSLLGSDILSKLSMSKDVKKNVCPFTGENLVLLRAIQPEYALVHVQKVDCEGNAIIEGALWDTKEMAMSAKNIIISAEEVVGSEFIRREPWKTVIPSYSVKAIVHIPYGAHPSSVYNYYDYDKDHLALYEKSARERSTFKEYLENYILSVDDYLQYLKKIGVDKLINLKAKPLLGY